MGRQKLRWEGSLKRDLRTGLNSHEWVKFTDKRGAWQELTGRQMRQRMWHIPAPQGINGRRSRCVWTVTHWFYYSNRLTIQRMRRTPYPVDSIFHNSFSVRVDNIHAGYICLSYFEAILLHIRRSDTFARKTFSNVVILLLLRVFCTSHDIILHVSHLTKCLVS